MLDCFPDQVISYQEFVEAYESKFHSSRMGNIGDLEQAFTFFDSNNDGKVTTDDVHSAFSEIVPIDFSEAEVNAMLARLSDDWKDGLDVHTFCEALCRCMNFSCSSGSKTDGEVVQTRSGQLRQKLETL